MHQNTAPRHIDVVVGTDAVTSLSVAGKAQGPVEYLAEIEQKILALTGPILGSSTTSFPMESRLFDRFENLRLPSATQPNPLI